MIRSTWNLISNIGITIDMSVNDKAQIRLLNKLAFLIICASLFTLTVNLIRDSFENGGGLLLFGLASLLLLFNSAKKYTYAKHLIGFIFPLIIGFLMVNVESNLAFTNIFIVQVILSFIIYEKSKSLQLGSVIATCLIGTCALIYISKSNSGHHLERNVINNFVLFTSSVIALIMLVSYYQSFIKKSLKKQDSLIMAIKEKNIDLERFAYVTSHDLKEPVRNIESLSKFISKTLRDPIHLDRNKKMSGMIKESSQRMSSLIDSILSYAKLESKDLPVEQVALDEIIDEFRSSHRILLESKNASVICDTLPVVNANRTFISLLFQNLIENGLKYNTSDQPLIEVSYKHVDSSYLISLKDNGIGINKEFRERIFEPFKRLHNSESFSGSGLGLSICKKIVDMHGGKIWVEDNPSGGSVFQFLLPYNNRQA